MDAPRLPRFDPEQLEAVLRPVEAALNLPSAVFTDPAVFELERRHVFRRGWICAGRDEELARPGAFATLDLAGYPMLLARGEDGVLRALQNACRHRGACLVQERAGSARSFRCQYHAWTYGTDGSLLAAPLMDERPGFEPAEHGLVPLRLESWGGFVFVNVDPQAPPLAEAMAGFPDFGRYGLEALRRAHRVEYEVAANWKIVCENYSECYHCALVHPQLNRVTDFRSGGRSRAGAGFNGGPMSLGEGYTTLSMSGQRRHPTIEGLTDADRCQVHYQHFYPTFLIGLAPDYVIVHRVEPLAVDRTRVVCDWYWPSTTIDLPDFDPADTVEFWDVTNRQDWGLCEMVQKGAASGVPQGPYHPLEYCVHAFDRWYVETLGEHLTALRG